MAETVGAAGSGHPNLNLNAEEKRAYGQLLKEADPDGFGAVSGDIAVKFFERTGLAPDVLGQIWNIADVENRGFLTPSGFGVVLRLIGHAQAGQTPSAQLATQVAPLPRFDGNTSPQPPPGPPPSQQVQQQQQTPTSPSQSGGPPIRVPPLTPEKVAEYSSLFEKSGAANGLLSGVVAKQIFERARLPNEVLGRIWGLSDTQVRGSLDVTEFTIAMHMLASYKSGAMRGVPNSLPPGLYDAAARRPVPRGGSGSRPTSSAIQQQFSGYAGGRPQSPIARQQVSTPLSTQSTGEGWLVSAADKARFDSIFASVDKSGSGYVSGEQAVEFFGNARLPEEVLAQIWDLSDINSEGRLDKDEFAVAMYLIRQQRGTRDGRGNLPPTLPAALIPPSKRRQQIPPSQPTAPAFENAPVTKPRSAADDLFGLDAFGPTPPQAQPQIAQSTGDTDAGPFANPPTIPSPNTSTTFKPFIPSSSFGQSLSTQSTGSPSQNRGLPGATSAANNDLLGDADPTESSKITNDSTELANLSNQVTSLSSQMTSLQAQRGQTEQELSQNSAAKKAFESRLGQLRTLYENEVKEVKALQEQLTASKSDTKRLQQDMAMIDGTHQDLSTQHQQLRQALEADQKENTQLKERIKQVNTEVEQLKPQLEKLKSDARQHKGLVAINKKQLSTNEAERDRIKAEIAAAQKEVDDAQREAEESNRQAEASKRELEEAKSIPVPVKSPPAVASPAPSTSSNPFFRRATTDSQRGVEDVQAHNQNNFDSIFGPSFGSAGAPAPATSFSKEEPARVATPPSTARGVEEEPSRALSATPQVVEPPAPPSANQITSSALPFRAPLSRGDSVSSSVKVAPPASRLSPSDTPRAETPDTSTSTPPASKSTSSDPFMMSAQDEEQESVRRTLPTGPTRLDSSDNLGVIPGAFPGGETPRAETPAANQDHTAAILGAGAVAAVAGGAVAAAATVNGEDKGKAPEREAAKDNFDEYFGGAAHQRTPSEQAKDFDSAFADMKKGGPTNGTANARSKEFPDIQELDDDESSDYSEETPMGFDDDFNKTPEKATTRQPPVPEKDAEIPTTEASHLSADSSDAAPAGAPASPLPPVNSESSPPTYSDAVPADNPTQFPREYKGLIPEREDPTSPTTAGGSTQPVPEANIEPPSYGPEIGHAQNADAAAVAPPQKTAPSPFDFDSAFAGVGPAQADDESSEDDEPFHSSHHHTSEFDPTFDTPTQSRSTTAASNSQQLSTYNAVTNGSPQPPPKDNFVDFNKPQPPPLVTAQSQSGVPQSSHDWDDIFSGLSSSGPNVAKGFGDEEPTPAGADSGAPLTKIQSTAISPDAEAITSAKPVSESPSPDPTAARAQPSASQTAGMRFPAPPPEPKSQSPERPALGRAISTTSEHDDPILKRLTAMGWSRAESLAALEKFDYNIDKAADYLTFRS